MKTFSPEAMRKICWEQLSSINKWLVRGDHVAVYIHSDLSSPHYGHRKFASYGSSEALFPGEPPTGLPDMEGSINWAYGLEGVYKGAVLPPEAPITHYLMSISNSRGRLLRSLRLSEEPTPENVREALTKAHETPARGWVVKWWAVRELDPTQQEPFQFKL